MSWFMTLADFLLSEWLWNVTWGWYHVPINIFVMLFLLKVFGRLKIMPAVLFSVFSQIFSFALFSLIVIFGSIYGFGLKFVPYDCYVTQTMHPLLICFSLGLIYFVLQSFSFVLTNVFYKINLRLVILIALVSNMISALLVYRFWSYDFL